MHWKSCFFSTPHQNNKFCITTKDAFCYAVVKSVCSVPAKLVTESWSFWHIIYFKFSNSSIIHQVKTKEITTMKEVWIPVLISIEFDDFTSPFTPWVLFRLRRYIIKRSRQCFIGYPDTLNFVKNTLLRIVFSPLFSVFGYPDETLSLVFDILLL